jgi:hypothetical protein
MGGGGGTQESKTTTEISPDFKPFITYGLQQARGIYEAMPEAPETLAVGPSAATQQALGMAEQRALAGSPLLNAAQQEQLATIEGRGINPFLSGALGLSNRLAGEAFAENIGNVRSRASSAGRYGSPAQARLEDKSGDIFARALAEQSGMLAYQSAEAERARQVAASQLAPTLGQADYADIQRLLQVGQGREGYDQRAIQGRLAAQEIPMQRLQQAANVFYGAPLETTTTQQATPQGGK